MDCELLNGCAFFHENLHTMPTTAERLKKRFCKGDFESCARYIVAKRLGRERVPETLYPNQADDAEALLKAAGATG